MPEPAPKLLFVATEDWFFASHFLPMVRAGRQAGLAVAVAARFRDHRAAIEAAGARAVPLDMERGDARALGPWRAASRTLRLIRAEQPAIVHAVSLRAVLLAGLAMRLAGGGGGRATLVQAVTGLGVLGADPGWRGRSGRAAFRRLVRDVCEPRGAQYLFENEEDARWLGLDRSSPNAVFVAGAGVDPERYPSTPLPGGDTLRVALVARMLWSKGIDLAVEAVRRARAAGANVELSLFGAPDPANPRAIPLADLRRWNAEPGVSWHGRTDDVPAVWRAHHLAILPSRGGEGLPRTLLEAASCGRAILCTDVPGCSDLVRHGIDGLVVPPNDAQPLADALVRLAGDRAAVARMGAAAAGRLRAGFTEAHVAETVEALYRRILAAQASMSRTKGATRVP